MRQGDGDYLLEEFHDADILLPEEREEVRVHNERVRASAGDYGESNRLAYEMQRAFAGQARAQHLQLGAQHGNAQRGAPSVAGALGIAALLGGLGAGVGGAGLGGGTLMPTVVHHEHRLNTSIMRMFGLLP